MALVADTSLASFDQGGNREDLSDVFNLLVQHNHRSVTNAIGIKGEAAKATKHQWVEGELGGMTSALNGALNTTATTANVATGDGVKFRIGTLFKISGNNPEVLQVTSITADALTVVRGYGSTSDPGTNYADTSVIEIISHPVQEDADIATTGRFAEIVRATAYNYTQKFFDYTQVSDTQEAVDKAGVDSELTFQVQAKLEKLWRELNRSLIYGIRSADAGGAASYRSMGGIYEFVTAAGGNATDAAAAAVTYKLLRAEMKDAYDDGGNIDLIVCGTTQKAKISDIYVELRRMERKDSGMGYIVETVLTDFGEARLVLDTTLEADKVLFLDSTRLRALPLQNLAMSMEDVARTGLARKKMISGEYTMEIMNATKAFSVLYNLSTA